MDSIEADSVTLSAMSLGALGAPPVALLHGLVTGNMATWYSATALPLSAEHRVLLYDLRGHGGSTMPASGYDLPSQANDLNRVLIHYGFASTPVDLVGHSVGALIALHFALRHPQRVRRLVLVDAPMPAATHVSPSLRTFAADGCLVLPANVSQGRRSDRLRRRVATLLQNTTLPMDVSAMQSEPVDSLAGFAKPVSLIYGTRSPCRAAGLQLSQTLPNATLTWLEAGHDLPMEVPVALLGCIRTICGGGPAATPRKHLIEAAQ
jgi:pimeloyl-ACP methyl ester carboxylesterase